MQIKKLHLYRFRNLKTQEVRFDSRITLIHGKNGQGKTSLIEAMYMLCQMRSFREAKTRELVCWDEKTENYPADSRVEAIIQAKDGEKEIVYEIKNGRRSVFINGKNAASAKEFYGQLVAVEFTPDDLLMVKTGPGERREFIDRTISVVDEGFVEAAVSYEKARRNRNALLKEIADRGRVDAAAEELSPWNKILAEKAKIILERRVSFLNEIKSLANDFYKNLAGAYQRGEEIFLSYESELVVGDRVLSKEEIEKKYFENMAKDVVLKSTFLGPHRDDLFIELRNTEGHRKNSRVSASQGQTRSIALALKFSAVSFLQKRTGEKPIILLDDVESELDSDRRREFYNYLFNECGSQVIITSTEESEEILGYDEKLQKLEIVGGLVR